MSEIKKIYDMSEMETFYDMCLIVTDVKDTKTANSNSNYTPVELSDGEKKITVNFFDETVDSLAKAGVKVDAILDIKLKKTSKAGKGIFYNKESFKICTDSKITKANFVNSAPIDADVWFDTMLEFVKKVDTNPDGIGPYKSLSYLTLKILQDNAEAFKRSSAAVAMHHNYLSGLMHHTGRMLSLAWAACQTYSQLDKELMICGTALHDIGKIFCYDTTDIGDSSVNVEGRLLDHAVVGIMMVHDAAKEELYNPEKIQLLEHMIASHHGKKEWDAITTPAIPEAEMLHVIDLADSRMNMFEQAYKGQQAGTVSTEKVFGLENSYIYKPLYPEG